MEPLKNLLKTVILILIIIFKIKVISNCPLPYRLKNFFSIKHVPEVSSLESANCVRFELMEINIASVRRNIPIYAIFFITYVRIAIKYLRHENIQLFSQLLTGYFLIRRK